MMTPPPATFAPGSLSPTRGAMRMLPGVTMPQADAMPMMGLEKSSGLKPNGKSKARAGVRCGPSAKTLASGRKEIFFIARGVLLKTVAGARWGMAKEDCWFGVPPSDSLAPAGAGTPNPPLPNPLVRSWNSSTTWKLLRNGLLGLQTLDVTIVALASLLAILIAVAASYVPARRASRVDPIQVRRHD